MRKWNVFKIKSYRPAELYGDVILGTFISRRNIAAHFRNDLNEVCNELTKVSAVEQRFLDEDMVIPERFVLKRSNLEYLKLYLKVRLNE